MMTTGLYTRKAPGRVVASPAHGLRPTPHWVSPTIRSKGRTPLALTRIFDSLILMIRFDLLCLGIDVRSLVINYI